MSKMMSIPAYVGRDLYAQPLKAGKMLILPCEQTRYIFSQHNINKPRSADNPIGYMRKRDMTCGWLTAEETGGEIRYEAHCSTPRFFEVDMLSSISDEIELVACWRARKSMGNIEEFIEKFDPSNAEPHIGVFKPNRDAEYEKTLISAVNEEYKS